MSKEQKRMMEAADKLVGLSANPLTKLFRKILEQRDIGSQVWNRRLTNYLNSPFSRVPKNAKDIGQERNNFNRAIARSSMTWKTFQKAVQVMGCIRYRITIDMEWRNGSTTTVDTGYINNPLANIEKLTNRQAPEDLDPTFADGVFTEEDGVGRHDLDDE